jgi:uncharacterized membrane protein
LTEQPHDDAPDADPTAAEVERTAAERVIFFSDAVVAIAITLLVLGLPVPHVAASATNQTMLQALYRERGAYLAFLISFVVIGAHWRTHHRLYRAVARIDRALIALNMLWLLMIIITPYATKLLYGNGGFGVRFSLYAAIQVITLVTVWLMGRHIRAAGLLRHGVEGPGTDEVVVLAAAAMFAISIPIAFVTEWAFACWVASVLGIRWFRRLRRWTGR